MGKNAILVRTLASERINETAPATGDDKFSYSSVIDNQVLRRRKKKAESNVPTVARVYSMGSDSQSS